MNGAATLGLGKEKRVYKENAETRRTEINLVGLLHGRSSSPYVFVSYFFAKLIQWV